MQRQGNRRGNRRGYSRIRDRGLGSGYVTDVEEKYKHEKRQNDTAYAMLVCVAILVLVILIGGIVYIAVHQANVLGGDSGHGGGVQLPAVCDLDCSQQSNECLRWQPLTFAGVCRCALVATPVNIAPVCANMTAFLF